MRMIPANKTILMILLVALFSFVLHGCYSGSKLIKIPQLSDSIVVNNSQNQKMLCFVSRVNTKINKSGVNTAEGLDKWFLSQLQKANYCSEVIYGAYSSRPEERHIDLSLDYNLDIDSNNGTNFIKAFFTGFTLFLLAPILPVSVDYYADFMLLAKWPDGIRGEYKESCSANAYGTFPYTSAEKELAEVIGKATEKCLNSVINQFAADRHLPVQEGKHISKPLDSNLH